MELKIINIDQIHTGYGFLVAPDNKLGDAIYFFEDLTDPKWASQWTHAGMFKTNPVLESLRAFEMEASGLVNNDFVKNYKGVITLVLVPKFVYREALISDFMQSKIHHIKYNFKQLFAFAGNAIFSVVGVKKRFKTSTQNQMVCSEFQAMCFNYEGGKIPDYFGKKPSDMAMMPDLFDYYLLKW